MLSAPRGNSYNPFPAQSHVFPRRPGPKSADLCLHMATHPSPHSCPFLLLTCLSLSLEKKAACLCPLGLHLVVSDGPGSSLHPVLCSPRALTSFQTPTGAGFLRELPKWAVRKCTPLQAPAERRGHSIADGRAWFIEHPTLWNPELFSSINSKYALFKLHLKSYCDGQVSVKMEMVLWYCYCVAIVTQTLCVVHCKTFIFAYELAMLVFCYYDKTPEAGY